MDTSKEAARGLNDIEDFLYREVHLEAAHRRVADFTARTAGLTDGQKRDIERWYLEEQNYVSRHGDGSHRRSHQPGGRATSHPLRPMAAGNADSDGPDHRGTDHGVRRRDPGDVRLTHRVLNLLYLPGMRLDSTSATATAIPRSDPRDTAQERGAR